MTVSNFANLGLAVSKHVGKGIELGKKMLELCPTYLDEIPEEVKEELTKGFLIGFHDNNPTVYYSSDWTQIVTEKEASHKVDIHTVMAIGTQEYGKLKESSNKQHGIYAGWRKRWSDDRNQKFSRLLIYVTDAKNELDGNPRGTRKPNKDFIEVLFSIESDIKKKIVNAKGRSDLSVDIAMPLYNDLIEVFKKHSKIKPKNVKK